MGQVFLFTPSIWQTPEIAALLVPLFLEADVWHISSIVAQYGHAFGVELVETRPQKQKETYRQSLPIPCHPVVGLKQGRL